MKKIFLLIVLFLNFTEIFAQVGIGTDSPHSSAQLHVQSANKGFLPPQVNLVSTTDIITIPTPAVGLFVYNLNTAGTDPTNVSPGYYYFDGSKWQRIINQLPDTFVVFNQNTPTTVGVNFTPNTPNNKNVVYASSTNGSQWVYNGTNYIAYSPSPSTAWYLSTGTIDAGSNKVNPIYRNGNIGIGNNLPIANLDVRTNPASTSNPGVGFIGIGTTTSSASSAGAGALRYNASTTSMEYSNGSTWLTFVSGKGSPKYAQFMGNASQNVRTISDKLLFPNTAINSGNWYSIANNNTITLPAGRIYRVDINLAWAGDIGFCRFAIYDVSNPSNPVRVSTAAHLEGANSGSFAGSGTVTTFIDASTSTRLIDVRLIGGGCTMGDANNGTSYPFISIQTVD